MIADFFTKPLQGTLVKKFWDLILNTNPSAHSSQDCRSVFLGKSDMWDQTRDMQVVRDQTHVDQPATSATKMNQMQTWAGLLSVGTRTSSEITRKQKVRSRN